MPIAYCMHACLLPTLAYCLLPIACMPSFACNLQLTINNLTMIKRIAITTILLVLAGAIASCNRGDNPSDTAGSTGSTNSTDSKYYCGEAPDGTPTTFVKTDRGTLPLLRWESDSFKDFGYTREQRCQAVSTKFETASERGVLNYVTIATVNNLPVVCAASRLGAGCEEYLFTLQPDRNAAVALKEIFAGTVENQNNVPYISFQEAIDRL